MSLRELMEQEIYKEAKYFEYVDNDDKTLPINKYFGSATVLHFFMMNDGGLKIKLFCLQFNADRMEKHNWSNDSPKRISMD